MHPRPSDWPLDPLLDHCWLGLFCLFDVGASSDGSRLTSYRNSLHSAVRVSRKLMLECSCERVRKPRQRVPGPRYRLQVIPHRTVHAVVLKEKTLLTLLSVMICCSVKKSESVARIDCFQDSAEIQRPQSESVHFNCDDLPRHNRDFRIGNPGPAQVEFCPAHKCLAGSIKVSISYANPGAHLVMGKTYRKTSAFETVF
jgi:hypothetical protein